MNLTDLAAELETRAADAPPTAGMNRLTGVRHRIRVRRRRQVASAAGLTALGVAAIVLGPSLSGLTVNRSDAPPATRPQPADPLVFAPSVDGDPLVATAAGAAGQTELVLRFTPTDSNLAMSFFCRAAGTGDLTAALSVNGKQRSWGNCSNDAGANQHTVSYGDKAAENRAGWKKVGVIPGRESVFRIRVTADQAGTQIPSGLRLGLGIYQLSGPRVSEAGVTFRMLHDAGGHSYQLNDYWASKVTSTVNRISMDVPEGRYPVQVQLGLEQTEAESKTSGHVRLYVDGKPAGSVYSDGGTGFEALDDAKAHTIEVRVDPAVRGTMLLAYYVRKD